MTDRRAVSGSDPPRRGPPARAKLPLLDRLIDDEQASAEATRRVSYADTLEALRASVSKDLENLLNTRRRWRSWDPAYAELDRSLVGYGLQDFATGTLSDPRRHEELRKVIEACILRFEPRISRLHVRLLDGRDKSNAVRLRIEALLKVDPAPEPIAFDTFVELDTKNVTVTPQET